MKFFNEKEKQPGDTNQDFQMAFLSQLLGSLSTKVDLAEVTFSSPQLTT